ncbi:MAG: BBP7 family outer membrane beta-barrel protein [Gemmataceae bacterium]|nr:BBP7 family outer membrane beta-barrel protein [Gemmataceae bacterium]
MRSASLTANLIAPVCSLLVACGGAAAQEPRLGPPEEITAAPPEAAQAITATQANAGKRWWLSADYMLYQLQGSPTPPLVTAAPFASASAIPGALGNPDTTVLSGGERLGGDWRSGVQVRAGCLRDCCGIDMGFFYAGDQADDFTAGPSDSFILTRPFINVDPNTPGTPLPDAQLVSAPGVVNGTVGVAAESQILGGELNLRCPLCCRSDDDPCSPRGWRIDGLAGYRIVSLTESLGVTENLVVASADVGIPAGTRFLINDRFGAENMFHGGQLGVAGELWRGRWSLDGRAVVALGGICREVDIAGATTVTVPGVGSVTAPGGFLTQPTNIGRRHSSGFAVVPAASVAAGYQATPRLRLVTGYEFLMVTGVARPGDQVDLTVNTSQLGGSPLAGPARPAFVERTSSVVLHGIRFGIEFRY